MSPCISIIVPIYNTESYLRRCIESVLSQTFTDFELLLIDDGSTDRSGSICDEYARMDNRVRVFHKENGGVSSARNLGLDNTRGEWIAFVDSDDWVKADYLKNMLRHTEEDVDMVIAHEELHRQNGEVEKRNHPERRITEANFADFFIDNGIHWKFAPWGNLYRRRIIQEHRLSFREDVRFGEDALFNYGYILRVGAIYTANDTDYCYFIDRGNSLTKRVNSLDSEISTYRETYQLVSDLIKRYHITNKMALLFFDKYKANWIRRILNALYYNSIPRKRRMAVLRSIDTGLYSRHIGRVSMKEELFKLLLKLRLFSLYDGLRYGIVHSKRALRILE